MMHKMKQNLYLLVLILFPTSIYSSGNFFYGTHQQNDTAQIATDSTTVTPLDVAHGGTGRTSLVAYALLTGGTTTTSPIQQVENIGTAGQVLTSNGAGALPTFQTISSGGISTITLTLTANQIKALRATPITIISAPGAGRVINVINCLVKLNYGGTAFTAAASQTIGLSYTGIAGQSIIAAVAPNSLIVATSTSIRTTISGGQDVTTYANIEDEPVVLFNTVATEITVGNSTMDVLINYQTLTI